MDSRIIIVGARRVGRATLMKAIEQALRDHAKHPEVFVKSAEERRAEQKAIVDKMVQDAIKNKQIA